MMNMQTKAFTAAAKPRNELKTLSIVIPTYNEEENVEAIYEAVLKVLKEKLSSYDYEFIFIDNDSTDNTRSLLRDICAKDNRVKAIFNIRNFGQFNSPYHALMQATGDGVIFMCADFQDPPELLPSLVKEWEEGARIVVAQKTASEESRLLRVLRTCYYKLIHKFSNVSIIEHFTGFGLYDKSFIKVMRSLHDPLPFLRGIVAELGFKIKIIPYTQKRRRAGFSKNNFFTLYDAAMLSFTSYTKVGLRLATWLGLITAFFSLLLGVSYLILKLCFWSSFAMGQAPLMIGMFFLGAVILIFLGVMGEYILTINQRLMNRPLVIEEERINFKESGEGK